MATEEKKKPEETTSINDLIGGIEAGDKQLDASWRTGDSTGPGSDHMFVAQGNATIEEIRRNPGKFCMEKRDKPGEFDLYDEVKLIILDSRNRQKLCDESRNVVCSSLDGKQNLDGSKLCRVCPDHGFNGGDCRASKALLAVWADNREADPFILHVGAQGISDWNKLVKGLEKKNLPIFGVIATFTTVERETSVKTFNFVPIVSKLEALPKEERAAMFGLKELNVWRLEAGEPAAGESLGSGEAGQSLIPGDGDGDDWDEE